MTQNIKRDPNPQKGPHGDPGPLKGTHCGTVMMGAHLPTVPLSPFITFMRTVTVNFRPRRAVYENVIVSLEDVDQGPLGTRGRVEQHGALSGVDKEDF